MNRSVQAGAKRMLPCLNSNNCIDAEISSKNNGKEIPVNHEKLPPNECKPEFNEFSTSHRKSAAALEMNVRQFIETFGIEKLGFLFV